MIKKVRGEDMGKKYNIIYADPPWEYERSVGEGVASNHYPTLNIEELRKLPVKEISDKDAFLFLWVTFPQLNEGISLFEAWGFKYKTCAFNWIKLNPKSGTLFMGLGFWTRSSSEICLLGIKGHPKRLSTRVWQVIMSERMRHSKKPDEVRKRMQRVAEKYAGYEKVIFVGHSMMFEALTGIEHMKPAEIIEWEYLKN